MHVTVAQLPKEAGQHVVELLSMGSAEVAVDVGKQVLESSQNESQRWLTLIAVITVLPATRIPEQN